MRQAIHDYLQYQNALGRSETTLHHYKFRLKKLQRYLKRNGVSSLNGITSKVIKQYHNSLLKLQASTQGAYLKTASAFLRYCYNHRKTLTDLAESVMPPKTGKKLPPVPLTEDDMRILLDLTANELEKAVIELMYATGIRKSELINLNLGDINHTEQTLFVRGKGNKDRLVPIHEMALFSISNYLQKRRGRPRKNSPLFVINKKRISKNQIERIFDKLNKRFHKHIYPHLIRHTFACHLLKNGVLISYLQMLLGHSSPSTSAIYLNIVKDDLKRVYDQAVEMVVSG